MVLPQKLDRPTVRLMAYKRLVTGSLSIALGIAAIAFAVLRRGTLRFDAQTSLLFVLLLAICFGGGSWSLRDGVRTLRMLKS